MSILYARRQPASTPVRQSRPAPVLRAVADPVADPVTDPVTAPGATPLLDVLGGDVEAPLADGGTTTYTNLDYAATAPCLRSVADRVAALLPTYASVHRGAGHCSQVTTAAYESARRSVGAFVGARDDDVVVFTRNTTDALNLLAGCVPAGQDVLFLDVEHHANLLPWQRRTASGDTGRCLPAGTTQRGTLVALRAELAARPYALVAVTGASNVTGEVLPVEAIVRAAHDAGARVVVDAAQLIAHRRFDLAATGADYVAFSGHKVYAPFGAGALVGRSDWLDAAPAYLAGGGAVDDVRADRTQWRAAPERHEGGTPNVVGAVALAHACETLAALPAGALDAHEAALRARLVEGLRPLDGVTVHQLWRDSPATVGVVAFTVDGHEPAAVAAYLSGEHGIGVRDGRFCAHPLLRRLGTPDGAVRASFGAGSRLADVERLVAAIATLVGR